MTARILMVDDEPDAQELFRQNFRREIRHGIYAFDFALSGQAALAILKDGGSQEVGGSLPPSSRPNPSTRPIGQSSLKFIDEMQHLREQFRIVIGTMTHNDR